jgi:hypothetical protein
MEGWGAATTTHSCSQQARWRMWIVCALPSDVHSHFTIPIPSIWNSTIIALISPNMPPPEEGRESQDSLGDYFYLWRIYWRWPRFGRDEDEQSEEGRSIESLYTATQLWSNNVCLARAFIAHAPCTLDCMALSLTASLLNPTPTFLYHYATPTQTLHRSRRTAPP